MIGYKKFQHHYQYVYYRNFFRLLICLKKHYSPTMQTLLNNIDDYLENSDGPFFKNSVKDTTTVGVVELKENIYMIKRYNFRNTLHGLKLRLRPSRAMRSWVYAHQLNNSGIRTLNPVAVVEQRIGPMWGKAYFISEFLDGLKGCEYFANDSTQKPYWPKAISAVEKMTLALKQKQLHHADYHFGNILMVNHEPVLLDLDKMKFLNNSKRFQHKHEKDLNNFRRFLIRNTDAYTAFKIHQSTNIF